MTARTFCDHSGGRVWTHGPAGAPDVDSGWACIDCRAPLPKTWPAYVPPTAAVRSARTRGFSEAPPLALRDLQDANDRRVPCYGMALDTWSPMEWCCAALGELGELANILKKRARKEDPARPGFDVTGKPIPPLREAGKEIADTVIYLALIASRLGLDFEEEIRLKWNEVSERLGYPVRL